MASDVHAEQSHGSPLGPRQYIYITLGLAVITAVELAASYSDLSTNLIVPALIIMSAIKFGVVVALFMHLKFESSLFTKMFMLGLVLGASILIALISLFWNDPSDAVGPDGELPPLEHSEESRELFFEGDRLL